MNAYEISLILSGYFTGILTTSLIVLATWSIFKGDDIIPLNPLKIKKAWIFIWAIGTGLVALPAAGMLIGIIIISM